MKKTYEYRAYPTTKQRKLFTVYRLSFHARHLSEITKFTTHMPPRWGFRVFVYLCTIDMSPRWG